MTRESESGGLTLSYTYDPAGNRTSMTASGTESYIVNYSYDVNNRLISSVYADGTHASTYAYDAAGNLLTAQEWRPQEGIASTASYSYNNLNQLASQTVNGRSSSFAYNADGIRTAKAVGRRLVGYLLDGGNVIGETEGGELVATYQRGINLISCIDPRDTNSEETYYIYNAHGDVVQLTDEYGNLTKSYEYDAFGNEKNKTSDPNPFRYCGEYYDAESGSYYLRARYYNPAVGRFTQEDTHWNTGNMIYGDEPQQIGEYKDPLGVSRYTYAPQTTAIMQAGNLYAYGMNNPVNWNDPTGEVVTPANIIGALVGAGIGALVGTAIANHFELSGWKKTLVVAGSAALVGIAGWFAGPAILKVLKKVVAQAIAAGKLVIDKATKWITDALGINTTGQSGGLAPVGTNFGKLGVLTENVGRRVVDWANSTYHGLQRMVERSITQQDVEAWVKCGKTLLQSDGKIAYIAKEGVVILDRLGRVITAYGSDYFDESIKQVIRQLYGK